MKIASGQEFRIRSRKKRNTRFTILKIAAAIVILMGWSVVFVQQISIKQKQQLILAKIDPNLAEQEKEFQQQIKTYYKVLQQTNYNEELLTTDFKDLEYIDTLIQIYSDDLKQNSPNTRLINSLMDLYQEKIKLLDRMLNEIEKSKNMKTIKSIFNIVFTTTLLISFTVNVAAQERKESLEKIYKLASAGDFTFNCYDTDLKVNT